MKSYNRHFTLIELIVILSMIMFLASMLIPALNVALEKGESIQCQGNMEQVYQALTLYAGDNRGQVPYSYDSVKRVSWNAYVYASLSNKKGPLIVGDIEQLEMECPSADKSKNWQFTTYALNFAVGGYSWSFRKGDTYCNIYRANNPGEVFFAGEKNPGATGGLYAIFRNSFPVIDKQNSSAYHYNVAIRHNDGGNWLYLDGHVDWQSSDKLWTNNELGLDVTRTCY